jgi:hypothetical protein
MEGEQVSRLQSSIESSKLAHGISELLRARSDLAKRGIIVVIGGGKGTRNYPSDITREGFEIIRAILESAKKVTEPRKKDLYDIFCAILYLIKSGCQWRMLPADFPKWGIVRYYYEVWSKKREDGSTLLEEVLKKIGCDGAK